jgi:hypothetical protein
MSEQPSTTTNIMDPITPENINLFITQNKSGNMEPNEELSDSQMLNTVGDNFNRR